MYATYVYPRKYVELSKYSTLESVKIDKKEFLFCWFLNDDENFWVKA